MSKMARLGSAAVVGLGLAMIAGCDPSLSEDFDAFCRVVNEVNKETSLPAGDRLNKITSRAEEYSKSSDSKAADSVWKKMADVPADKRYAFLTDAAHGAGKGDYRCSGYEKLLVTYNVEVQAKQRAEEEKQAAETAKPDAGVSPDAGTDDKHAKKTAAAKTKKTKKKRKK